MKHLFSHKGCANRAEFVFWLTIFNTFSGLFFIAQMEMSQRIASSQTTVPLGNLLAVGLVSIALSLVGIVIGWCSLTLYARRLHDLNLRGWWYLGFLAVLVVLSLLSPITMRLAHIFGVLFFLCLALVPGKNGENRFGSKTGAGFYPRVVNQKPVFIACLVFALVVMIAQSLYSVKFADAQVQQQSLIFQEAPNAVK